MKKLTCKELQNLINALHDTHKMISKEKSDYVCLAINKTNLSDKLKNYLHLWIDDMLDGRFVLSDWAKDFNKLPPEIFGEPHWNPEFISYMRNLRLQWVMWMINQLEDERSIL